ncbi:cell division protein FtsB [Rhodoferax sp. 4810]|uniref:Cell division protein FtsB n=2 Tax=Thiospirillum jenense TaxID=1653858 RepID=A0A839H8M2_9GAMM|nr:cell division protein FtsB [Thiospirillum jenense]MBB1072992.1 cell division protein FtsB [Rhodoferax jenense]MBB1124940.1 cell division protein FtsB [Thiospirillum jenense]
MRWLMIVLIVLLSWLQYRLWLGTGSLEELYSLKTQLAEYQTELKRLEARNRALAAEVDDLKVGYAAIEERARFELGMIKHGELFLQLVEQPAQPHSAVPQLSPPIAP